PRLAPLPPRRPATPAGSARSASRTVAMAAGTDYRGRSRARDVGRRASGAVGDARPLNDEAAGAAASPPCWRFAPMHFFNKELPMKCRRMVWCAIAAWLVVSVVVA